MQELLQFLVCGLVDKPESVEVTFSSDDGPTLQIKVDPDDMGKVIGRNGRVIKALRTVMTAVAQSRGEGVRIEVV